MEIWLDTINLELIEDASKKGLLGGVTTNPSILSKANNVNKTLISILDLQEGPLAVQVTSSAAEAMVEEGRKLFQFSNRIVVKVPVNNEGIIAINQLKKEGIAVLATGILTTTQALLAYNLRADYIAPYFSHMENSTEALETMAEILKKSSYSTKILAASLREVEQVIQCARLGIDVVTIKDDLFLQLIADHPVTDHFCKKFAVDWSGLQGQSSISDFVQR